MKRDRVACVSLSSIASNTLNASVYKAINSSGFDCAPNMLRITNDSSKIVYISFDGVNDHEVVRKTDSITLEMNFWEGCIVYVKGSPDGNFIYVSGYTYQI